MPALLDASRTSVHTVVPQIACPPRLFRPAGRLATTPTARLAIRPRDPLDDARIGLDAIRGRRRRQQPTDCRFISSRSAEGHSLYSASDGRVASLRGVAASAYASAVTGVPSAHRGAAEAGRRHRSATPSRAQPAADSAPEVVVVHYPGVAARRPESSRLNVVSLDPLASPCRFRRRTRELTAAGTRRSARSLGGARPAHCGSCAGEHPAASSRGRWGVLRRPAPVALLHVHAHRGRLAPRVPACRARCCVVRRVSAKHDPSPPVPQSQRRAQGPRWPVPSTAAAGSQVPGAPHHSLNSHTGASRPCRHSRSAAEHCL